MQQYSIYNNYYINLMQENYKCLVELCDSLEKNGYWKEPEELLQNSIHDTLDLYVQGVLIHYSIFSGRLSSTVKGVVRSIPDNNILNIIEDAEYSENAINTARHIVNGPPILLQLCSLYDYDKGTNMGAVFLDNMMTVLIAFASLDAGKDKNSLAFVEKYYERSLCFVNDNQIELYLGKRYLFKKISSDTVRNCVVLESGLNNSKPSAVVNKANTETKKEHATKEYHKETDEALLSTLQDCVTDKKQYENTSSELDQLLKQLDELIGLIEVKKQINSLINLIKVRKLRESYNMPTTDMTYHMVFSGNPGTGKTTVARLLSKIYCELGLLSKGTLVETDRSGLVAGFVGQTAIKVSEVVKSALGGVLFIDEAYSLSNQATANDYGSEAIDTLVKMMEDHRDDLVVIVAGYTEEMRQFLKANTGLISRFNTFIEFPDYTTSELIDILKSMAGKAGLSYTKEAVHVIQNYLDGLNETDRRELGNARGIRNLFEKNLMAQANRIVSLKQPTKRQLATITLQDVQV